MLSYLFSTAKQFAEKKIEKKEEITYQTPRAKAAQPAHPAHQGHGGLLPRPAPPSCSVECHRASRATATPPSCLEASQASLSRPGDAPKCHTSTFPLQSFLLFLFRSFSSPPKNHRGARRRNHAANINKKPRHDVHHLRRRQLRLDAEGIVPGSFVAAAPFVVFHSGRRESTSKSGATVTFPPPATAPLHSTHLGEHFPSSHDTARLL